MLTTRAKLAVDPDQTGERQHDPKKAKRQKRAHVTVFANWCKECGLCVAFCPQQVFEEDEDGHPLVAHPDRCTGCNWCTMHCPDFAIVVHMEDVPESRCQELPMHDDDGEDDA